MSTSKTATVSLLAFLCLAPASEGDRLVLHGGNVLSHAPLPKGSPESDLLTISAPCRELVYLDDGRLMGLRDVTDDEGFVLGHALVQILEDGTVSDVGPVEPPEDVFGAEDPLDLAVDAEGRLFLLSYVPTNWNPPDGYTRLVRLDPDDGAVLSAIVLSKPAWWLARAPEGVWARTQDGLEILDPDSGLFTKTLPFDLGSHDADTDSTGALWLYGEGVCSPPCFFYHRFDPATGSTTAVTNSDLNPAFVVIHDLAVERQCQGSDAAVCLQGGRFQVEARWQDADGATGSGKLTPARSADSGVYWLFDPANWELNVKVLDGCALNEHFWVFASGSTDVGLTLTVTDLVAETEKTYENPLGRTMVTVTDTAAFPCR